MDKFKEFVNTAHEKAEGPADIPNHTAWEHPFYQDPAKHSGSTTTAI